MSCIEEEENFVKEIEKLPSENVHYTCVKLGEDVMTGKKQLVKIVELLGPLLTNTDIKQREKGVTVLSDIICSLKPDYLSAAELTFLIAFFCDRMKDHHSLASVVLRGVLALIDMNNLPSDSPILVCTSLFSHIHCQTLTQPERNMVYRIFHKLLFYRIEDLKPLGIDFVLGFITAIDSERDPQNLMLVFSIVPRFLASFSLLHLVEEAFNVISCYFPIDFNAAADDNSAYTREDLAKALTPCLIAIPEFAEFCVPLILEKLDSNLKVAKMDSLLVLREGCRTWPLDRLKPHLIDIWLSLKRDLLPGSDSEIRDSACETLVSLISKLDEAPDDDKQTVLTTFTDDIISSTAGLLCDMSLSLFGPAIHVLVTASSSSEFVCKKIISYVVPRLYALPQGSSRDTVIVIRTLNLFLKTQLKHSSMKNSLDTVGDVWCLLPEMLLTACTSGIDDVQAAAFDGLLILAPFLSDSNRSLIYEYCQLALSKGNELVMDSCLRCLRRLAELYPLEVTTNLVESKLLIDKGSADVNEERWRIEALCSLLLLPQFTRLISDVLLNIIDEFSPCTSVVLHSLRTLLENTGADLSDKVVCDILTKRLVAWWVNGARQNRCPSLLSDEGILTDTAAIFECLIRPLDSTLQSNSVLPLIQVIAPLEETGNGFNCLNRDDDSGYSKVVLLEGLLESLHQNVSIPSWQTLTNSLSSVAFSSSHRLTQLSASRLLATLMNKQQNDESLALVLGHVAKSMEEKLKNKSTEVNAVRLLSWITKALVLRGHSLMSYWLDKLTDQLSNRRIGKDAAEGFRLIMSEDKHHLTLRSHCTVRILYKQRLFQRIPILVSASRSSHPSCKINYLLAIAHFVQAVPRVVLLPYLRQVVLPMVESLDYDDDSLELITLETLSSLLSEKETALESYTDTFIPRFLKLAQQSPFMKVRMTALECIKNYAGYPPVLLMPYVQTVTLELEACLDDKKRLVRRAAVDARSKWFLIGAPTDDD